MTLIIHIHWTTEDDERADMRPLLGGHLAVKQPHDSVICTLLVQHLAKKSQIFKWVMLKNQDLFHRVSHSSQER